MGQSINTTGLLLAYNKNWLSKWYIDHNYTHLLHEDLLIRNYIKDVFKLLEIHYGKCIIERNPNEIQIYINIYKKKNQQKNQQEILTNKHINQLLSSLIKLTKTNVKIVIKSTSIFDAQILSQYIAHKLEQRQSFVNIFNKILTNIKTSKKNQSLNNISGIKVQCSGRPSGNDMANIQWFKHGQIPLHTYKYKIDYAQSAALTKYGLCGVKVWISHN